MAEVLWKSLQTPLLTLFATAFVSACVSLPRPATAQTSKDTLAQGTLLDKGTILITHEPGQFSSQTTQQATSDGMIHRQVQMEFRSHRRDFFWPYPGEVNKAMDYDLLAEYHGGRTPWGGFEGTKAVATLGYKFMRSWYGELAGGVHIFRNEWELSQLTFPVIQARLLARPAESVQLDTHYSQDLLYQDWIQSGAATDKLSAQTVYAGLEWRAIEEVRVLERNTLARISDGNRQQIYELNFLYGISRSTPWVWAGLGAQYQSFSQNITGYWAPFAYYCFGPRLEAAFPVYRKFAASGSMQYNWYEDSGQPVGTSYYGNLKISYGQREALHIELSYTPMGLFPGGGEWNRQDLGLAVGTTL